LLYCKNQEQLKFLVRIFIILKCSNGYWLGSWSFNGEILTGRVDTRAHIFENGHVHFHEFKESSTAITGKDTKEKCMNMIQEIMNMENKIGLRLAEYYNTDTEIGSKVFKGLRRPLPFTRQPMDWDMSVQSVIASIRSNENN
jgi:capping protein alpha